MNEKLPYFFNIGYKPPRRGGLPVFSLQAVVRRPSDPSKIHVAAIAANVASRLYGVRSCLHSDFYRATQSARYLL